MRIALPFVTLGAFLFLTGGCARSTPPATIEELVARNASLDLIAGKYSLWTTAHVDPKTKRDVAPTYTLQYYLQTDAGTTITPVAYSYRATTPMLALWVFPDRTVVLFRSYPASLVFVTHRGEAITNWIESTRLNDSAERPEPLLGCERGLIMQPCNLNHAEPLFFVPWNSRHKGVDFTEAKQISELPISVNCPDMVKGRNSFVTCPNPSAIMFCDLTSMKTTVVACPNKIQYVSALDSDQIIVGTSKGRQILNLSDKRWGPFPEILG